MPLTASNLAMEPWKTAKQIRKASYSTCRSSKRNRLVILEDRSTLVLLHYILTRNPKFLINPLLVIKVTNKMVVHKYKMLLELFRLQWWRKKNTTRGK